MDQIFSHAIIECSLTEVITLSFLTQPAQRICLSWVHLFLLASSVTLRNRTPPVVGTVYADFSRADALWQSRLQSISAISLCR